MAETVGSIIDKLCINKLKMYHVQERLTSIQNNSEKIELESKLEILKEQGKDLSDELQELLEDLASGKKKLKVYRQYKM